MIAIDTSALVALLFGEPEADRIAALLDATDAVLIGAPTALDFVWWCSANRRAPRRTPARR